MPRASLVIITAIGCMLWFLSTYHPVSLPFIFPWSFSWPEYLATALAIRLGPRNISFLAGVTIIYLVLQTHFEFWAQHMFFISRVQQAILQNFGPFLIALALKPPRKIHFIPATALFIATSLLWLMPKPEFAAMLSTNLYFLMNASMVVSGVIFWAMVLDTRPRPPAACGRFTRLVLVNLAMFPMIIAGVLIGSASRDLYPNFSLCGRILPGISAIADQQLGGLLIWLPAGLLTGAASLLLAHRFFESSDQIVTLH